MAAPKDASTKAIDKVADAALVELELLFKDLDREIRARLKKLPSDKNGRIPADITTANLVTVRGQILSALKAAGRSVVSVVRKRSIDAVDAALASITSLDDAFKPNAGPVIADILAGRNNEIAASFGEGQDSIRRAMNVGVVSGANLDRLIANVAEEIKTTFGRARSAVDTAIVMSGRAAVSTAAANVNDDADEVIFVMRYVGPDDAKTRPFCRRVLGKCFTPDALAALDNGQGLPVESSCGGYNCRHGLAPILASEAKQRGFTIVGNLKKQAA